MFQKRLRALALASLASSSCVVVGCGSDVGPLPEKLGGEDRASALAAKLEADTGVKWLVRADERTQEVRFVMPLEATPSLTRGTPEETVRELYKKYANELGASDPTTELAAEGSTTDEDGMTHLRFEPKLAGTAHPIFDEASLAHVTKEGAIAFLQPSFRRDLADVAKEPAIEKARAFGLAVAAVERECKVPVDAIKVRDAESKLGVHTPMKGKPALAYRFRFDLQKVDTCVTPLVDVDAKSGEILELRETAASLVERQGGSRFHLLNDHTDKKDIEIAEDNSLVVLKRWTMLAKAPVEIKTRRYTDFAIIDDPVSTVTQGVWEPNEQARGASVDAHHYMQVTASYYANVLGRRSYDGNGTAIVVVSHDNSGKNRNNAYSEPDFLWMGGRFHFGDGDYILNPAQNQLLPFSAGLDVVAHEFTHAVTEFTSKLVYEGESGALNESMSDVFGATIENWNPATSNFGANLRIGERVFKNGFGLRDMHMPATHGQPDHYTKRVGCNVADHCGVHTNSGIPNHAWFLMTHGGVNSHSKVGVDKGIGWAESAKLWYLTNQSLLYPRATFHHAALAQVGQSWYRRGDYLKAVACAWNAVGVFGAAELAGLGVTCPTVTAGCSTYESAVVCSEVSSFSAYICQGRQIAGGMICDDPGKRCRPMSALDPRAVIVNGRLACD